MELDNASIDEDRAEWTFARSPRLSDGQYDIDEELATGDFENQFPESSGVGSPDGFLSIWNLVRMFAFFFSNGLLVASYFIVVLPIESGRIDMDKRAVILGGFIGIAGVTQIVCPVAGLYSDRCTHRLGKRRPFILYGGLVGSVCLLIQLVCRDYAIWWLYCIGFTCSMICLNVVFAAMNGVLADFVPPAQVGTANGVIAGLSVSGAVTGFAVFQLMTGSVTSFYLFYFCTFAITCAISFYGVSDSSCKDIPYSAIGSSTKLKKAGEIEGPSSAAGYVSWSDIKSAFYIDPVAHWDFFIVLVSRTLYYMGVSSQTFLMYYLRDVISMSDGDAQSYAAVLAVAGQFSGIVPAIIVGYLSDKLNQGRKVFIYISCAFLAGSNLGLVFARSENIVFWIACFLGLGNGVYLSCDASLAIDTLPRREEAARFMGIWGVGAFIGTALGPMIGGPFLVLSGHEVNDDGRVYTEYGLAGYSILLTVSAIYFIGSAFLLRYVQAL